MQRPEGGVVRGSVRGVGEAGEELLGVGVKEVAAIQLGREVRSSEDNGAWFGTRMVRFSAMQRATRWASHGGNHREGS